MSRSCSMTAPSRTSQSCWQASVRRQVSRWRTLACRLRSQLAWRRWKGWRASVIEAGQRERQRLERDLHDGAQQRLIALSLELGVLEKRLSDDPDARRRLDEAQAEITRTLDELRSVARGIHPAVLTGHGLAVALEQVAALAPVPVRLKSRLTNACRSRSRLRPTTS